MNVAFFVSSRATCSRVQSVVKELHDSSEINIHFLAACSLLESQNIQSLENLLNNCPRLKLSKLYSSSLTDDLTQQSRILSDIVSQLSFCIANQDINLMVVTGDRFETLAASIVAAYSNIPLMHIQGGDLSGNIDQKVRYATTYLADYHVPCSLPAYKRLTDLGISRDTLFFFGCPSIDLLYESISLPPLHFSITILNYKIFAPKIIYSSLITQIPMTCRMAM